MIEGGEEHQRYDSDKAEKRRPVECTVLHNLLHFHIVILPYRDIFTLSYF